MICVKKLKTPLIFINRAKGKKMQWYEILAVIAGVGVLVAIMAPFIYFMTSDWRLFDGLEKLWIILVIILAVLLAIYVVSAVVVGFASQNTSLQGLLL